MFEERIGFMASLGFAAMAPGEALGHLKALGYGAVEWTPAHFNPRTKTAAELGQLVEQTREAGLAVSEVVIQQDYVTLDDDARRDRIAYTLETIEACAAAGVDTVNLFTGPAPWDPAAPVVGRDLAAGTAWAMVHEAFAEVVPVLARCGVYGAVEGVWGHLCNDYYTTRPLIDHFDSPWLGVNFDPSHDVLKGNLDTAWLVRAWGKDRIRHVHLKDAAGVQSEGLFLFPLIGEGRVDWPGMLTALREIGYEGWLSVEFESFAYHAQVLRGDTVEAARRTMADLRALFAATP